MELSPWLVYMVMQADAASEVLLKVATATSAVGGAAAIVYGIISASKDWRESDWIGRIQWLKARCEAEREFRGEVQAEMQNLVRQIKALKS